MQDIHTTNKAEIIGVIASEFSFSHEAYNESFFKFTVCVKRLSDMHDDIAITASEHLLHGLNLTRGDEVHIMGQYRSYNNFTGIGNRLILTLFAKEVRRTTMADVGQNPNSIFLDGFICKPPVYRTTPFGREITDILLATNRTYNKSDYIPCITWGRNARFASTLDIGAHIKICGRMQSRLYQKRLSENESEEKVAYEISVAKIEVAE